MRIICDIEADGFLEEATKVWCAGVYDIDSGATSCLTDLGEITDCIYNADLIVGHNWLGFDIPVMEKLTGKVFDCDPVRVVDTYELSMTLNPNRKHAVEDWAVRLGVPGKVEVNDWINGPIELYCARAVQDVKIEFMIFKALLKEMGVQDWDQIWK